MTPIYLDLDTTGQAPANKQTDEEHVLTPNRPVRAIVLDYGAFFTKGLVVKNKATGKALTRGTDYKVMDLYKKPSMKYGSEICGSISIEDPTIATVLVTYQALGGSYGLSNKALYANIGEIELDDKPVDFTEIIGKPDRYTPLPHLHDAGDLFGLEYIVRGLEEVRDAIILGDQASHDEIYRDIEYFRNLTQDKINDLRQRISDHISDFGNPHAVTAFQAGTYTKQEVDAILTTANTTLNQLATALEARMTSHFTNYSNAHGTTPAMLGGITMAEFDAMLSQFQQDLSAGANGYWETLYNGRGAISVGMTQVPNNNEGGNGWDITYTYSSPYGTIDGRPIAWQITNNTPYAQYYLVSHEGNGSDGEMIYLWVDNVNVSNSMFAQVGDPKNQLTMAYVGAGSTLYVSNANDEASYYGYGGNWFFFPGTITVTRWTRQ